MDATLLEKLGVDGYAKMRKAQHEAELDAAAAAAERKKHDEAVHAKVMTPTTRLLVGLAKTGRANLTSSSRRGTAS
jgi:hypothetical protein